MTAEIAAYTVRTGISATAMPDVAKVRPHAAILFHLLAVAPGTTVEVPCGVAFDIASAGAVRGAENEPEEAEDSI